MPSKLNEIRGRNISRNSRTGLAKDSRNGSSLIPTEREPNNNERKSPDEASRFGKPAGAAGTTIRYKTKGDRKDSSPRPKIKNTRLCDKPLLDNDESKKVTP